MRVGPTVPFFHVWADGQWRQPLDEIYAALTRTPGQRWSLRLGVVGSYENQARVRQWRSVRHEGAIYTTAYHGSESVTINALRRHALDHDGVVIYAHTKGAATVERFRDRWRRSMALRVIAKWPEHVETLRSGEADAIGCHWLTEEGFPGMFGPQTIPAEGSGFFGGNFWMATCEYLRTLPECEPEPRWKAESWIGIGKPRVVDLLPGWPGDNRWPELCA